jgi:MMP 1-O-methyltransferase
VSARDRDRNGVSRKAGPLEDIELLTSQIDGWLHADEGRLLYGLARDADPTGRIVEIGSWHGKSTIWLAAGAKAGRGARVAAIDPHRGTSLHADGETTELALRRNLERAGVADQVDPLVATSEQAEASWKDPVSLLWIDGDHAYESVKRDLLSWERHLLPRAVVALHDTFFPEGPERVVREQLIASGQYTDFGWAATVTCARRRDRASVRAELARRISILRRNLYGVRFRAYDGNTLHYADLRNAAVRAGVALSRSIRRPRRTQ